MIADLKPYAEYKESGLPWLGQVPAHWQVKRLKNWVEINTSTLPESTPSDYEFEYLDIGSVGTGRLSKKPTRIRFRDAPSRARRVLRAGDTIVSTVRTYLKAVVTVDAIDEPLIASTGFAVLTPREHSIPRCLGYVAQSEYFTNQVTGESIGIAYPAISETKLANILVTLPPTGEQAAIVRFLDWANGRLERAIRAKRKVIALLGEQKQAIIHRGVTRGLDPSVPLKPSGIPWLGDTPRHWSVLPLKRVVQVRDGTHDTPPYVEPCDSSFPLVTSKDFGPSAILFDRAKHISEEHHKAVVRRSNTERGDVLMSMIGGNIGKALIVDTDRKFSIKNVALFKTCDKPVLARFVLHYLQSGLLDIQIALLSKGGAQGFLGLGQIRNLPVAMMPAAEMEHIVKALDLRLRDYDRLIAVFRNSIDLVTEYRTRLVADVVTGKLDVREAAARVPDEAPLDSIEAEADLNDETEGSDEEAAA